MKHFFHSSLKTRKRRKQTVTGCREQQVQITAPASFIWPEQTKEKHYTEFRKDLKFCKAGGSAKRLYSFKWSKRVQTGLEAKTLVKSTVATTDLHRCKWR